MSIWRGHGRGPCIYDVVARTVFVCTGTAAEAGAALAAFGVRLDAMAARAQRGAREERAAAGWRYGALDGGHEWHQSDGRLSPRCKFRGRVSQVSQSIGQSVSVFSTGTCSHFSMCERKAEASSRGVR